MTAVTSNADRARISTPPPSIRPPVYLDFYEQLRQRTVAAEFLGARILVAHPEDLIRIKAPVSRPATDPRPRAARI
jgi:hypothetical protein